MRKAKEEQVGGREKLVYSNKRIQMLVKEIDMPLF